MSDEEKVIVKTTVPQSEKDIWAEHADMLGMTQAEFVRSMVQAGRRGFELDPPETPSPASTPRGNGVKDDVLDVLRESERVTFEEIVDRLVGEIEVEVDGYLQWLHDHDKVEFNNREGYKLNGGLDGDN